MFLQSFVVGPLENNVYLLGDPETRQAALIDPGMDSQEILETIRKDEWKLEYIINTHGHRDHIFNNAYFKEQTAAKLLIHPADLSLLERLVQSVREWGIEVPPSPQPDLLLEDGQLLTVGSLTVRVMHTPGHSPGGVCLYTDNVLFSGDTLFAQSVGAFGSISAWEELVTSIRSKLYVLPDDVIVYPGHGPPTTIGVEKRFNPFVRP